MSKKPAALHAEQALKAYTRSLELAENLLKANPHSAQAARDLSVSLEKRGDFLARRDQPGDAVLPPRRRRDRLSVALG